jgi:AraC family transcriptional regulator of arabinose operon
MDEADEQRLTRNGIPFDCPARLESIDELSHIVHLIAFEHFSSDLFHREIRDGYTEILFLKLGRAIHSGKADSLGAMDAKNDRVTYLRTRIYENPAYFAGVDEMADFVGLSRSGLQHLYTRLFGIHVLEDVISARIEMAKKLLGTTTMTVAEIAERCGYRSEYHFMRQFKQRMAATPTEFRNGDSWNQIAASR